MVAERSPNWSAETCPAVMCAATIAAADERDVLDERAAEQDARRRVAVDVGAERRRDEHDDDPAA